jgi:hypothetical protein
MHFSARGSCLFERLPDGVRCRHNTKRAEDSPHMADAIHNRRRHYRALDFLWMVESKFPSSQSNCTFVENMIPLRIANFSTGFDR